MQTDIVLIIISISLLQIFDSQISKISINSIYVHMTRNARWRSRRPRYRAAAHVPNFYTLVPAPELSLPIQCVVIISKGIIFCIRERPLLTGNESVEIRYVSGSSVAGTSTSSPGVPRHMPKYLLAKAQRLYPLAKNQNENKQYVRISGKKSVISDRILVASYKVHNVSIE